MPFISRKNILLMLIGLDERSGWSGPIGGMTRLQKLLYLLQQEEGLEPKGEWYEFLPYKAGPYSPDIYDDLEFLENLGLITSEVAGEPSEAEAAELEALNFEALMGNEDESEEGVGTPDAYEEHRYRITEKGKHHIEELLSKSEYQPINNGIRKIKSKYGKYSLNDLLHHVYKKYPDMTVESEIKNKILQRRR